MTTLDKTAGTPQRTSVPERGSLWYLSGVCMVAALGGLLFGFDTAVISGAIGLLKAQFALGPVMEGWVVSSALMGCITGAMAAGTLSDRFGRKKLLILAAGLFLISALGSAIPQTPALLIVARMVGGLGVGFASMLAPLYISEFSPPHLRGRMVALYQFAITAGVLGAYFSNAFLLHLAENDSAWFGQATLRWIFVDEPWRGMFGAEVLPATLFLLLLLAVPESPRWLTKQQRQDEATSILARVSGRETATRQMNEIRDTIAHESGSVWQLFQPGMRIALWIGVMLPVFSQVSGINVIIYYGEEIFDAAGWQLSDALGGLVIIGIVNTAFTLLTLWKIDSLGRKPILQLGSVGVVASLIMIGLLFHNDAAEGPWLLGMIMCYIACFAIGLGPIPWVIISEIFPTRIRGRAMSFGVFAIWTTCALVSQTFPWLKENLGPAGCFWLYASLCAPSILFVWAVVPETKGKTLEEIEKSWTR
ncbi:MAG: sugar porter family MFS transporter [Pirellulaceae bacterium]